MKTSANVMKVSAQLIRTMVQELWTVTTPDTRANRDARQRRRDALNSLTAIAEELEQAATEEATEGSTTSV